MRYDIAVIGTGPAGLSAAINAKNRNRNIIIFGKKNLSDKIISAHEINNYLGLYGMTGMEVAEAFKNHIDRMGIEITEENVISVYPMDDYFSILSSDGMYESSTVILATGISFGTPVKGEKEFLGKGVSYCATCDGALYKNKDIAVICASPKFEDEVTFLAGLANHIYLFTPYKETTLQYDNITHFNGLPASVDGDKKVASVTFKGEAIPVSGAFFLKDSINPGVLLSGLDMAGGHIIVDRTQMTNIDGVYAAGDCTGRPYQYAKAVGEGNVAVHSVLEYLKEHKDN